MSLRYGGQFHYSAFEKTDKNTEFSDDLRYWGTKKDKSIEFEVPICNKVPQIKIFRGKKI